MKKILLIELWFPSETLWFGSIGCFLLLFFVLIGITDTFKARITGWIKEVRDDGKLIAYLFWLAMIVVLPWLWIHNHIKSNKVEQENLRKIAVSDSIVRKTLAPLISKYNIIYELDTLKKVKYTIDYKPIIDSKYQLIKSYKLNDVDEKDGVITASIHLGLYSHEGDDSIIHFRYTFDLMISDEQYKNISGKNFLVVSISEIKNGIGNGTGNGKGILIEMIPYPPKIVINEDIVPAEEEAE